MDPDNKYLETLNFVVNFLHDEGFHKAHSILLQEFSTRLQGASPSAEGAVFAGRQSTSACSAPPSTMEFGERALDALSPPRSKSAQPGPGAWEGFPGPPPQPKAASTAGAVESLAPAQKPAVASPAAPSQGHSSRPSAKRSSSLRQRHPLTWDGEADEYEGMDDPGYSRRDVPSQARFAETELDGGSEEGSEKAYFMHQPGDLNYDDVESEVSASDPEAGITAASSVHSGRGGSYPGDAHDETWDLGPTDIKFAEPVSTPSKSPEKQEPEERRPVLSRVESLSSSFKDFEMERGAINLEGEEGQLSSKVSESEYVADPEVIDFRVTTTVVNHDDLELFRQNRNSRTSSVDVAAGSMPQSVAPSVAPSEQRVSEGRNAKRRPAGKGTNLLKALTTGRTGEARENGGMGGGFSFPVTPPSDEPDQRLFTSWPSVRSSCTSEPIAMDDDDNALPAEYEDDEYSKYRLSSRSTSMAAHDFPLERKPTDGEASGAPPSPDGVSTSGALPSNLAEDAAFTWEFRPPLGQAPGAEGEGSGEPSLEFSAPNSDDEDVGTPRTVPGAAILSQGGLEGCGSAVAVEGDASAALTAEGPDLGAVLLSSRGTTADTGQPLLLCPPPLHGLGESGEACNTQAEVASPQQGALEQQGDRKESPDVVAHQIHLEHSRDVSGDGCDTEQSPGEPITSGSSREAPLGKHHRSSGGVEQTGPSRGQGHGPAAFPYPASTSYDGDEEPSDIDDVFHTLRGGLGERLSSVADELPQDDELGPDEGDRLTDEGEQGPADWDEDDGAGGGSADLLDKVGKAVTQDEEPPRNRSDPGVMPRYHMDEHGNVLYEYEPDYIDRKYEVFELRVIHRRHRTGFEETKDFPIRLNDLIAGRYQVMDFLGSAAFSRAVQALDVKTGQLVCLKIIKNNKDYFDQSLDEIKLLKYVNSMDPNDEYAVVRLYDFFYYKEHLFLVCELLRANLYEFQKYNKESGDELYFTNARIQRIAVQALRSLAFLHSLGLIHSDLKPENILIKSYSRCEVKVIDLGSSCFITDQLSSYVQSRSYRAPEVILGLPYDYKVDVWSLGCILAELSSGYVLFQNDSLATLLARLEGILGPIPEWMLHKGRYAHRFYTRSGLLYERSATTQRYELLTSKRTSLRHRMPDADEGLMEFVSYLLTVDPRKRPTAADALKHPWLQAEYPSLEG